MSDQKNSGGLWVWLGMAGMALVLSLLVGLGVYFYMAASAARAAEAVAAAGGGGASEEEEEGPPPASVKVAAVSERVTQQRIRVVGRLMEVKRSTVAAEVEGRVLELLTPAGREVVGGESVMARIDPVWSELAVRESEADLAAARATARRSANELANFERLAAVGSADPQELDDARAVADADAARVLALEAALARARESRERVEIIAPFDGTVSKKLTEKGQWLSPGSAVVEVVSRGLIDAVIDVPEQYISSIKKGTPIQVTIDPLNETINGEVVAVNPDGSSAARTFVVKVRIDDRDGLFKVGMSVTARVPVNNEQTYLVVPRDAVQYAQTGPRVWMSVVMPGSAPGSMPQGMPMDVEVLFGDGDVFAVKPQPKMAGMDLRPGMDVVVQGAERLWPSRPLLVADGENENVGDNAIANEGERKGGDDSGGGGSQ